MNNSKKTITVLTILSLFISYFIITSEIQSLDLSEEGFFLGSILFLFLWLLKLALLVIGIHSLFKLVEKRNLGYFINVIITIVTLIVVIVVWYKVDKRESSPIILEAHYDGDINGITLSLRKNDTYKIQDYSLFGGTDHFGKYSFNGDTILLNKEFPLGEERNILDNKLLRRNNYILIKADSNGIYQEDQSLKLKIQ